MKRQTDLSWNFRIMKRSKEFNLIKNVGKLFTTIVLLICPGTNTLSGQSIKDTIDFKEIPSCAEVAFYCQKVFTDSTNSVQAVLNQVLDNWENTCGKSEPQQRAKILLAIADGTFKAEDYKNYYLVNSFSFARRMEIIKDSIYDNRYEYQKYQAYYDFVPIGEAFDNWTISFANQLKMHLDRKSDAYLLCVLFSEGNDAFRSIIQKNIYRNSIVKKSMHRYFYPQFNISIIGGAWFPLNTKNRTNFGISPQFGIRGGVPISPNWRLEVGIIGKIWTVHNDIIVHYEGIDSTTTSRASITFGLSAERNFHLTEKLIWDINAGVAYEALFTKIEESNNDNNNNSSSVSVGTANFSLGTNFRIKTNGKNSIGININYHFVPFNLDRDLKTELSNQAISTNLIYRF